jgi:hypothetical protein
MDRWESIKRIIGPGAENWTEQALEAADEDLRQYVALAWRIFLRLESETEEKPSTPSPSLTVSEDRHTIIEKVPQEISSNISPDP